MGHRNPYRISVDHETGFVYWGEVGPDARVGLFLERSAERSPDKVALVCDGRRLMRDDKILTVSENEILEEVKA